MSESTSAPGKPLRFAVVGAGGIAQMMHLPHLAERPDRYKIQTLVDIDESTLSLVGDRYQIPTRTRDVKEAVSSDEVDAVLICASGSHREAIEVACAAGKHVLVEKPMAYDLEEAETLAQVAKKSRGTFMVGYHKRFDPHYRRAREEVLSMKDLRYVDISVLHPDDGAYRTHHVVWPNPDDRITRATEDQSREGGFSRVDGGDATEAMRSTCKPDAPVAHRMAALLATESLIHDINAVRGVLGNHEQVLSAHVWEDGWAQSSLSRFANEVRVSMSWVFLPGLRNYQETLRFVSPEKRVTLVFPSPYLRNYPTKLVIERASGQELEIQEHTVSFDEAFACELRHFYDCVVTGSQPELSEDDAVADARFVRDLARCYA